MNAVTIEHVPLSDLPKEWQAKLNTLSALNEARVTVRIEEESAAILLTPASFATNDPAFGMWRDREDMADVESYLSKLRAPRYLRDGTRGDEQTSST